MFKIMIISNSSNDSISFISFTSARVIQL